MSDIALVLPQAFTQGDTRPLKIKLVDNGDGTFSWDISASLSGAGMATSAKQDTTNIKLDTLIEIGNKAYTKLIDEDSEEDVTYVAYAVPTGSEIPLSGAHWRIKRIDDTTSPSTTKWADGDLLFNNVWDDRLSLDYY